MFDFSSTLFWYKLVFTAELVIAESLATYSLKKKPKFALRVVACLLGIFVIAFLFPIIFYNAVYSSFMFIALFCFTIFGLKICYDEPFTHIVFCAVIAYTTQHMAYETFEYFTDILGLGTIVAVYDETGEFSFNGFMALTYGLSYALIYWAVWAFVEYRIRAVKDIHLKNISLLFLSAVIVLVDVVLSAFLIYDWQDSLSPIVKTVLYLYCMISCVICLVMQFLMLERQHAERELQEIQAMWRQNKKMFEVSKENVELINAKCHDLKKQIRLLRKSDEKNMQSALKEIENAINFYDSSIKTGNEALDLVIAEKSLYCAQHDIKFTCIADGSALNNLSMVDLYSLFENGIQNAIDAVSKYSDSEKRLIRAKIMRKKNLALIHIENYFEGQVTFVDGLPSTSKEDKRYHGYGIRSMKLIAEKYGGGLNVTIDNDLFSLDVVVQIPSNA